MLRLRCPICGLRDEDEFTYGGDASLRRPPHEETRPEPWAAYVFERKNPCGPHLEYWQHQLGCRQWLVVERDTRTNAVTSVRLARQIAEEAAEGASEEVAEDVAKERGAALKTTADSAGAAALRSGAP